MTTPAASMTTSDRESSKRRLELASVAMAFTVAIIGAIPLAWLLTRSDGPASGAGPVTTPTPTHASVDAADPKPEVDAAGLHPAIVRVLESGGFARATGRTELEGELAPAVLDVLIANGVVLTVPENTDAAAGGLD